MVQLQPTRNNTEEGLKTVHRTENVKKTMGNTPLVGMNSRAIRELDNSISKYLGGRETTERVYDVPQKEIPNGGGQRRESAVEHRAEDDEEERDLEEVT